MALLVRARLSSLDDDEDDWASASSLSSAASSPPLSPAAASPPPRAAVLAAPRVAAQLSSTEEDVSEPFDGTSSSGDDADLDEEVSNGFFFSVARVPPPEDLSTVPGGEAARAVSGAEPEGGDGWGTAEEPLEDSLVSAESVFEALDAGVIADGDGTGAEGSLGGSFLISGSFIGTQNGKEAAASGDFVLVSDGAVLKDDDKQGEEVGNDAASEPLMMHVAGVDDLGTVDVLEGMLDREVAELLPIPSATEGDGAGAEIHSSESDAEASTTNVDASPDYAATRDVTSDVARVHGKVDDPDSIADDGHDKVDEEADGDHEASDDLKFMPISSSEDAVELAKELEDNMPTSKGMHFGVDDSDDVEIYGDDEFVEGMDGKEIELFDYAALIKLLRAASSSPEQGKAKVFPVESSEPRRLPPTVASNTRTSVASAPVPEVTADLEKEMTDEENKIYRKVDMARIKYMRLVHRLGYDINHQVPVQVLYRLSLVEGFKRGRMTNHSSETENAWKRALQHEAEAIDDLEFSCNVLVLGKTGVGKSATINSIFGEDKCKTNAFLPATSSVKEITGVVDGVKFRVIDTPGLGTSSKDEKSNRKVLNAVKKYMTRCPPDIILYVDRLDTQREEANSLFLLRSITSVLGLSIWPRTIITLSHSGGAPPEGPNGSEVNYDILVTHRTRAIQQSIRQITNDPQIENPVALVENHHLCRRNAEGEKVLPDGLIWRRFLLLLCYSLKLIAEIDNLSTRRASSTGFLGHFFQVPPIPYFLSSLLQYREHPRHSNELNVGSLDSDFDLDELLNGDQEDEEDDYDQLPPFKPLSKSQVAKLSKEQQKLYFDEYDYRTKLLQKKHLKEQLGRFKEMKKKEFDDNDVPSDDHPDDGYDTDRYPMPEWTLPSSFDSDDPVYRYRCLVSTPNLMVRAVNNPDGWDHDCGFDGVSVQHNHNVANKYPASLWVQVNKDKRQFTIHLDSSMSVKHGDYASSLAGFDIQTMMNQLAYTLRGETKFKGFKKNITTGGLSMTFLGNNMVAGAKLEDKLLIGNRLTLSGNTGAVSMRSDAAYGVNVEATLHEKTYPVGQGLATLGASLVKWRKEWTMTANLDSHVSIGRSSNMAVHVDVNNKLTGRVSIKASTSEQLNIALLGTCSVIMYLWDKIHPGADSNDD
ncbi:translocase of chloroplast 159, chloroplastic [Zea mays]|uniref:Translocase of chloroplast 159 chloroplastic n=1 Tax=Zea mays TaxID=4577 RepID=A0A096TUW0_MAIZE|nr:translocase of chloroplast 159, chloroplastic [Zea mays]XP_008665725.2 translocase of chloroplast 159, chloroplastic [Zea mays]ONM11162.1 Translocase of chloroplast 159 chloroplastic [Zea mays]|eukprot:XP_008665724.2 translocase of chloroplast 159, chloroplastic [Zea mays]